MGRFSASVGDLTHRSLPKKVGVITVTYNSSQVLPEFFESLEKQTYQNFVLIAIDNASKDGTVSQLREQVGIKLIVVANTNNVGVAAANNQGIREALAQRCDAILLLNNDVFFGPDLIANLIDGLSAYDCDMTTPLIYYSSEPKKIWAAGGKFQPILGYRTFHIGENEVDEGQFSCSMQVTYAPTCCVLIRAEVFQKIGLMDERYFVYSDDVDFMYRAMREGLSLFVIASAKLWHKVNGLTGGALSDFTLYYGARGRSLFLRKHLRGGLGLLWTWLYMLFYIARPVVGKDSFTRSAVRRKGIKEGGQIGAARFEEIQV